MKTYKERTESILQKAEMQRNQKRKRIKLMSVLSGVACACVCAVTLSVCLPTALSDSTTGTTLPPQIGMETPPDAKPPHSGTETPPETKPPHSGTETPPETKPPTDNSPSGSTTFIEQGFVINSMGEPISPLMIAYKMERQFDEDGDISVQLAFGEYRHNYDNRWGTKFVISVYNHDNDQTYVLKELTAEQFLVPEYDVTIKDTIEENEYGELTTTAETRTFNHQETFTFPRGMFSKDKGSLVFNILAYDGDECLGGSGIEIYYAKRDGKIDILTYSEYKELEKADQTPPKTDITVTPA
ncbi:MAG: hypothetical protein K2M89_00160 [Clostridiales bacterium]|nr:hypothetical protein [Clostridiales bacterium]